MMSGRNLDFERLLGIQIFSTFMGFLDIKDLYLVFT